MSLWSPKIVVVTKLGRTVEQQDNGAVQRRHWPNSKLFSLSYQNIVLGSFFYRTRELLLFLLCPILWCMKEEISSAMVEGIVKDKEPH